MAVWAFPYGGWCPGDHHEFATAETKSGPKPTPGEVSGDGIFNSCTETVVAHRPPPRNKPAAEVARNKQAAGVERHTLLAV